MNKNDVKYSAFVQILKEELVPAMGCTEPIALAFGAAKAREVLDWEAELDLSAMCKDSSHWQTMNPDGYPDE